MSPCLVGAWGWRLAKPQQELAFPSGPGDPAVDNVDRCWDELHRLRTENAELRLHSQSLEDSLRVSRQELGVQTDQPLEPVPALGPCSESHLRAALASPQTTLEDLDRAVLAAEALLGEARRELGARRLRARRAAYEELHAALDAGSEEPLARATATARDRGVDSTDIAQAEAKLAELRAVTDEERAAKAARDLELSRKKQAFLLVKKNASDSLRELLQELGADSRPHAWKDHAGRSLLRCARDLSAPDAQRVLEAHFGPSAHGASAPVRQRALVVQPLPSPESELLGPLEAPVHALAAESQHASAECEPSGEHSPDMQTTPRPKLQAQLAPAGEPGVGGCVAAACSLDILGPPVAEDQSVEVGTTIGSMSGHTATSGEDELKRRALRAVVQDDCETLMEVLQQTPSDVMSRWQNKAGKDLLTLSEERGSTCAYSLIAKALGMMKEMKRDSFEERESVWVFVRGEVQPRRATVLEDTPEESDDVLLEYWDDDSPAERVERCRVRRMWA